MVNKTIKGPTPLRGAKTYFLNLFGGKKDNEAKSFEHIIPRLNLHR